MSGVADQLSAALADRYRIGRELGRGATATVFLAEDLRHHRQVALKVLDPVLGATIGAARFLREIETVASLTHPHILPLHDSGAVGGLLYYVMPYVEGESLRARLVREKQLALEDALRITREVADALGCAHRHGVVHRDIKPENILLESGHAVVADFGLARVASPADEGLTASGIMVGTPVYMSPEQAAGSRQVDGRSDLYSLGCVLYEMLAGQPPYTGPTAESVAFQHLNAPPPHVTAIRPGVPIAIDRALTRALAKAPADRHATVEAFVAGLAEGPAGGESLATTAAMPARPRFGPRRLARLLATAAGVAGIALVLDLAWQRWATRAPATTVPMDQILVAAFEGPDDDSSLAVASRELICAALEQSRQVAPVPRERIAQALEAAGRPRGTRVDADLARELAFRLAVRAVLEGRIGRIGSGYSIVLRLVDADTLRTILTEAGTARNADALIPALGDLAKRLRAGLGENRRALAATRRMALVMTPSFEAYKLYLRGLQRGRAGDNVQAKALYRAALALDPDFATAWGALRGLYLNLGFPDSAVLACDEALRRPARLTEAQRAQIENTRRFADGDWQGAIEVIDRALLANPDDPWALAAGNDLLWWLGRYEDALARVRRYQDLQKPFAPPEFSFINEAVSLVRLGRFDEARRAAGAMTGVWKTPVETGIELAAGNYARAESLQFAQKPGPREAVENRGGWELDMGAIQTARGQLAAADSTFARFWEENDWGDNCSQFEGRLVFSALCLGRTIARPPVAWPETTAIARITRGLEAAYAGDLASARRCLEEARRRPRRELTPEGPMPVLLEATLAGREGRWNEAARLLRPIATRPRYVGVGIHNHSWIRWTLADAYERLGRPDSAAAHLERITREPLAWMLRPYASLRLVELYARLGRGADARRHWSLAMRAFDRPDPEVRLRIERARAAMASTT